MVKKAEKLVTLNASIWKEEKIHICKVSVQLMKSEKEKQWTLMKKRGIKIRVINLKNTED